MIGLTKTTAKNKQNKIKLVFSCYKNNVKNLSNCNGHKTAFILFNQNVSSNFSDQSIFLCFCEFSHSHLKSNSKPWSPALPGPPHVQGPFESCKTRDCVPSSHAESS